MKITPCHSVAIVRPQEARQCPACDDNPHSANTIENESANCLLQALPHESVPKEILASSFWEKAAREMKRQSSVKCPGVGLSATDLSGNCIAAVLYNNQENRELRNDDRGHSLTARGFIWDYNHPAKQELPFFLISVKETEISRHYPTGPLPFSP